MENNKRLNLGYGLMCLILGGLWLLNTMDLLPWQLTEYLFSWQFLLVIVGSIMLIRRPKSTSGLVMISGGLLFSVSKFWSLPLGWEKFLPPIALLAVGALLVLRTLNINSSRAIDDECDINQATVFGNLRHSFTAVLFKGGYLSAIFGSNTIDFTSAHLGKEEVRLNVTTVLGNNTLQFPPSWEVRVETTNILGTTKDDSLMTYSKGPVEGVIIISGVNILGQLKIQH